MISLTFWKLAVSLYLFSMSLDVENLIPSLLANLEINRSD